MTFAALRHKFWSSYDPSRAKSFIGRIIDEQTKLNPVGQGTHFICYSLSMGNMKFAIKYSHLSLNNPKILSTTCRQWVRDLQLLEKQQILGIPPFDLYIYKSRFIFVMPFGNPPTSNKCSSFNLPELEIKKIRQCYINIS